MFKYVVFLWLSVLFIFARAQAQTTDDDTRRQHEAEFARAVVSFAKVVEKRMGVDFKGDYPKTTFLWTENDIRSFPRFWAASYLGSQKLLTLGERIEVCDPQQLLKKVVSKKVESACAQLRGTIAHEYGHHYLHLKAQEKTGWLTPCHSLSILCIWNRIVFGQQNAFARRLVDEGVAETFESHFTKRKKLPDSELISFGTELPTHFSGPYGSLYAWNAGRIVVEPVLKVNFHRGLKCILDHPLVIETFYMDEILHMKTDSMFRYRKQMIKCAKKK